MRVWLSRFAAVCLAVAALGHFGAFVRHGWLPYRFAPIAINAYWSSLAFVDVIVALCLLWKPRLGWVLGLIVMFSDVAVVSYASHLLGSGDIVHFLMRVAQWVFLAFLLASAPFVLPRAKT